MSYQSRKISLTFYKFFLHHSVTNNFHFSANILQMYPMLIFDLEMMLKVNECKHCALYHSIENVLINNMDKDEFFRIFAIQQVVQHTERTKVKYTHQYIHTYSDKD